MDKRQSPSQFCNDYFSSLLFFFLFPSLCLSFDVFRHLYFNVNNGSTRRHFFSFVCASVENRLSDGPNIWTKAINKTRERKKNKSQKKIVKILMSINNTNSCEEKTVLPFIHRRILKTADSIRREFLLACWLLFNSRGEENKRNEKKDTESISRHCGLISIREDKAGEIQNEAVAQFFSAIQGTVSRKVHR